MFSIVSKDNRARAGEFETAHGVLKTPYYMPVGTKGTVKDLTPEELDGCDIQSIICNSFLLSLKPGAQLVADHGGLHSYMQWKKGIFTDSGGFQILLEQFLVKKAEDGIVFRNPFTGESSLYTPAMAIHNQHLIGSDVAMVLDDVAAFGMSRKEVEDAFDRTHRWLALNIEAHKRVDDKTNPKQQLFAIAQGGIYEDLREKSARLLLDADVDGYAIGGLAIGEPPETMFHAIEIQTAIFEARPEKPRYVMGLGSPLHMVDAIGLGVDMFDSIFPTQSARRGTLFTWDGVLRIGNAKYASDLDPIDKACDCYACKHYTRSYVHHMLKLKERIGLKLASIHNIHFVQSLMGKCREAIIAGNFDEFARSFKNRYTNVKH